MSSPAPGASRADDPTPPDRPLRDRPLRDRPLRALGLILLASLAFASLSAVIKGVAPQTGLAPPILARGLVGLAAGLLALRLTGRRLQPRGWPMLALRCGAGGLAMWLYYWAFVDGGGGTDLATAAILLKTSPLWVALLSPLVVREHPGAQVWAALAVGLAGVALRYGVSLEGERLGVLAALGAGLLAALAYLALRALARTDDPLTVVTVFSLFLTAAPLPFLGEAARACTGWDARTWALLLLAGVLGTGGQLLLTAAYRWHSAAAVTVGGLSEVAMALGYSVLLFGQRPTGPALGGAALALGAGLLASRARRGGAVTATGGERTGRDGPPGC